MKSRWLILIAALLVVIVFGWQVYAMVVWSDPDYRDPRRAAPNVGAKLETTAAPK